MLVKVPGWGNVSNREHTHTEKIKKKTRQEGVFSYPEQVAVWGCPLNTLPLLANGPAQDKSVHPADTHTHEHTHIGHAVQSSSVILRGD